MKVRNVAIRSVDSMRPADAGGDPDLSAAHVEVLLDVRADESHDLTEFGQAVERALKRMEGESFE